jgi:hypothetical protein
MIAISLDCAQSSERWLLVSERTGHIGRTVEAQGSTTAVGEPGYFSTAVAVRTMHEH